MKIELRTVFSALSRIALAYAAIAIIWIPAGFHVLFALMVAVALSLFSEALRLQDESLTTTDRTRKFVRETAAGLMAILGLAVVWWLIQILV